MRIEVYYEDKNNPTILDVPDDQCEIWVEDDYQRRLAEAEDNSTVEKRTVQQIMNEDFNNPTFNNNQTETRRHVSFDALEELGIDFVGEQGVKIDGEEFAELRDAIAKLKPKQQELIRKVFYEQIKQSEVAENMGIKKAALSRRLSRIYKQLKELLTTTDTE